MRQQFLLHRGLYRPEDYIGAVIASCDKFQTGFVVGMDSTFIVPEGCNGLMLAINDVAGRYDDNKGQFDVFVTVGDAIRLLGDAVLRRNAWLIADKLGWAETYDAEYLALTKLQADAFVTLDAELARGAEGVVPTATFDALRTA